MNRIYDSERKSEDDLMSNKFLDSINASLLWTRSIAKTAISAEAWITEGVYVRRLSGSLEMNNEECPKFGR